MFEAFFAKYYSFSDTEFKFSVLVLEMFIYI